MKESWSAASVDPLKINRKQLTADPRLLRRTLLADPPKLPNRRHLTQNHKNQFRAGKQSTLRCLPSRKQLLPSKAGCYLSVSAAVSAVESDDDMDLDLPLPIEPQPSGGDKWTDEFPNGPVALSCVFIGLGQGGGRIAEAFYRLGYRKVFAINTAAIDLASLKIPDANKLCLDSGGAGKDLAVAKATASKRAEDIRAFLHDVLATNPDRVFLCCGLGGGSGAGMFPVIANLCYHTMGISPGDERVSAVLAWPKLTEGTLPQQNAAEALATVDAVGISSILWLDNDRIVNLYRPSASLEYATGNSALSKLFHAFNCLAATPAEHTSFDAADFKRLLIGNVVFGTQVITDWASGVAVSDRIRKAVEQSLLAPLPINTAMTAGLVFMCGPDAYDTVSAETLDQAFSTVGRLVKPGTTVFRGVYRQDKPGMTALFGFGHMACPYWRD